VDSKRVKASPGQQLNLTATIAPDGKRRLNIIRLHPGWPCCRCRPRLTFPGRARKETGSFLRSRTRRSFVSRTKECMQCHSLGTKATREIAKSLGTFKSSVEAWGYRTQTGRRGPEMTGFREPVKPDASAQDVSPTGRIELRGVSTPGKRRSDRTASSATSC